MRRKGPFLYQLPGTDRYGKVPTCKAGIWGGKGPFCITCQSLPLRYGKVPAPVRTEYEEGRALSVSTARHCLYDTVPTCKDVIWGGKGTFCINYQALTPWYGKVPTCKDGIWGGKGPFCINCQALPLRYGKVPTCKGGIWGGKGPFCINCQALPLKYGKVPTCKDGIWGGKGPFCINCQALPLR